MLFNSLAFALFFPVVTIAYFLMAQRWRWSLLLAASCFFYMFFRPIYMLILVFTIAVDYSAGLLIESASGKGNKKFWLIMSIIANVGVLAIFKYYNFINENLSILMGFDGQQKLAPVLEIMLPVGLSFHTFQAMSYTLEVYYGREKAERHPGIYALYVMFYPQLVAGPIERPQELLPQFREHHPFDYRRVSQGLNRMLWGFFKKMVIADRLGYYVDAVYSNPEQYSGWPLIWATFFFSIQIYCDFSGYCDIALGASRIMGFRLMENFNLPYFSASVREFWSRWHISLSTWFRDYLYIPLGGNRSSKARWIFSILLVFMLSGLWHGAQWTFVVWGLIHGILILLERISGQHAPPHTLFRVLLTFLLVNLAWIFFRADTWNDAKYIVSHLLPFGHSWIGVPNISTSSFLLNLALILFLFIDEIIRFRGKIAFAERIIPHARYRRYFQNAALVLIIVLFGVFEQQTFIYFQF